MKHLCFIFFFFHFFLAVPKNEEATLILQSYSIEQLGRSTHMFLLDVVGSDIDSAFFKQCEILLHIDQPIHTIGQSWLYFVNNNFHYLPCRMSTANYSKNIKYFPSSLYVKGMCVMLMKHVYFSVLNVMNDTLIVNEISTFSREVFSIDFHDVKIESKHEYYFDLFICPQKSGTFSTFVLISTNKGIFPYSITYEAVSSPKDTFISTVFHPNTLIPINISIKVPAVLQAKKFSILYDTSVLAIDKNYQNSMICNFSISGLSPGFYVTFINFISSSIGRGYPIFLTVSPKFIQSLYPVILLSTITNSSETSEVDIKIVNPTLLKIQILSVQLVSDAPSNIKIQDPVKSGFEFDPQTTKTVGKIIMTGQKTGDVVTNVEVVFESIDKIWQMIEIPVKGYVTIGSFIPSASKIEIIGQSENFYLFNFFNDFSESAFVVSAYIDSDYFSVVNFEVFVVGPKKQSKNIYILCEIEKSPNQNLEAFLYIETNITKLVVPISGYNGKISISKNTFDQAGDQLDFSFGDVYVNSERYICFFVSNHNPVEFHAKLISSAEHISITSDAEFSVLPFSTKKYKFRIKFNDPNENSEQKGKLFFKIGETVFSIEILWTPLYGNLNLTSSLDKTIVFGLKFNVTLFLTSTYLSPIRIKSMESIMGNCEKIKDFEIEPNKLYEMQQVIEFVFDSDFLSHFPEYINISENIINSPIKLPIEFTFFLEDGYSIKTNLTIVFKHASFYDRKYSFGLIPVNSKSTGNVSILNFFDLPVLFNVQMTQRKGRNLDLLSAKSEIVEPGKEFFIMFAYTSLEEGRKIIIMKVSTNATTNFYIELSAEAVPPYFSFVSNNGSVIRDIEIKPKDEKPMKYTFYLKNDGNIQITIDKLTSHKMKRYSNCGSVLDIAEKCEIKVIINPKLLQHKRNELSLDVESCKINKSVKIVVFLDDNTIFHIKFQKLTNFLLIMLIAVLPMIWDFGQINLTKKRIFREYNIRLASLGKEIDRLSVSKRSSMAIQTSTLERKPFVGKWARSNLNCKPVSKHGIETMARLLDNIK